ncbi:glycoside hydrolase family 6 protein [Nannochloropsis oceanica]
MPRLFHPAAATAAVLASMLLSSFTSVQAAIKTQNMRGMAVTSTGKPRGTNIFKGADMYVNPYFQEELDSSIATASGEVKKTLKSIRGLSSAYWLDVKSKVHRADGPGDDFFLWKAFLRMRLPRTLPPPLLLSSTTCPIAVPLDPIVQVLKKFQGKVPIALVIEPDSLPNLATNLGDPRCGSKATVNAYEQGVAYAVEQIGTHAPDVMMYLDSSHGGWLGWEHSLMDYLAILEKINVAKHVRGFALNTANYQPVGEMCPFWDYCLGGKNVNATCCADPCKLAQQYNAGNNEMNFALMMHNKTTGMWPSFEPRFVIDTGRNGQSGMRESCSNWCNIRGAGIGHRPTTDTGSPLVDAFLWLKTPGESDGCTQILPGPDKTQCPRFDSMCMSPDSIGSLEMDPRAPEAGLWFDYQIKELAANANLDG